MFSYLETKRFYLFAILGSIAIIFGSTAIYTMYAVYAHVFFALFALVFVPIMWLATGYVYFLGVKKNDWESRMITAVVWVFIYVALHFFLFGFFTGHIILDTLSFEFLQFQWVSLVSIVFAGFLAHQFPPKN